MRAFVTIGLISALSASPLATARDLYASPEAISAREQTEVALGRLASTWVERGGLEIVTGGASSARTQSRWGHVSLRFVGSDARALEDLTIEAMALTGPEPSLPGIIVKGALGGFIIAPVVKTLGELIREYYFRELRGYARTIVPSTAAQRRALIEVLRTITRERTGHDRYYFLTTNCTSYASAILSRAGFAQLDAPVPFLPTHAGLHLRRSFVSPWPDVGGVSAERLRAYAGEPTDFADTPTLELQRLIVFRGLALGETFLRAAAELRNRGDLRSTDDVYGVTTLDDAFYHTDAGRLPNPDEVRRAFDARALTEAARYNRAALNSTYATSFCRTARAQCAYFARAQALVTTVTH